MDEPKNQPTFPRPSSRSPSTWSDLPRLALLLVLAIVLRGWLIAHTVVPARDSIGFIRYAWQLRQWPDHWREILRQNDHPPLYPLTILAASGPVGRWAGGDPVRVMQLSAQAASALAGVLLIVPMFFLGREVLGRQAGFWGAAIFQCLPVPARITSDALSEGVFLLLVAGALALGSRAMRRRSWIGFAGCGLLAGLAYLTRPEGVLVVLAVGMVLLGLQAHPAWRWPWRRSLACLAGLAALALIVALPYMVVIGGVTNKPTALRVLGNDGSGEADGQWESRLAAPPGPLFASVLGVTSASPTGDGVSRAAWGVGAVIGEIAKDFHYLGVVPVLLGIWWFRDRIWSAPGVWIILAVCGLQGFTVWRVAALRGYVSERHTLLLVLCGCYWGAAAVPGIARRLYSAAGRWSGRRAPVRVVEGALFVALLGFGLPEMLKPLHANREGHRTAGAWLARNARPCDEVLDPFCWAHYYAGRLFLEGAPPSPGAGEPRQLYVVLEHSKNAHAHLPLLPAAREWASKGTVVYHCPVQRRRNPDDEVVVYRVPEIPPLP